MGNSLSQDSMKLSESLVVEATQLERQVDFKIDPLCIPENAIQKLDQSPMHSGEFGDIWKCSWRHYPGIGKVTNMKVAIKSIRAASGDETSIKRAHKIRRAAYVWITLKHANIVEFYGIINGFGLLPALVFPWMENGSLDDYLNKRSPSALSRIEIFDMLGQIAAGLSYLHAHDIVHGDLRCTNVLMSDDGRLCLTDFGLVMVLTEQDNMLARDVRWMAPEIIEGGVVMTTKRADIYSYGCIMLQLLSGQRPYFWLKQKMHVISAISRGAEPFRMGDITDVDDSHKRYLRRCLSSDSQNRPDISEIVEFLGTT